MMTPRLPARVGLVAFIVAVLLGVFLSLPAFHSSYALEGLDITLHGEVVQ
ncbi:MAG TPA: hypothetical protein VKP67_02275 [Xanthobacteraceae bacterium]|nr:hypothetical protein [Xanthobacteraceae bacterium]